MSNNNQGPQLKPAESALHWLKTQSRPARIWILLSLASGLLSGILLVGQAHLLARVVHDAFMAGIPRNRLMPMFTLLLLLVVARAGLVWCREQAGFQAGAAVRGQIRKNLLAHMMAGGPVSINHLPAGSLVSSVLEQVEALHDFVAHYLPQLALSALLPLVLLAFICPISWAAGGVLLVTAPLIPLFMILVGMGAESISQRHFQALARMSAHFLDVLRGLTTLKLFGRSKDQSQQIGRISRQYRTRTMAVLRVAFLSSAVLEFFSSHRHCPGGGLPGHVLPRLSRIRRLRKIHKLFCRLFHPAPGAGLFLCLCGSWAPTTTQGPMPWGLRRKSSRFSGKSNMTNPQRTVASLQAPETICLKHVSVRYNQTRRRGLTELDLTITRGERIAVVGKSGAGKSTLIHLLLGFISPSDGQILIDRTPLGQLSGQMWRRHCAWIGQTPMLFSGSLKENIAMARPEASDAQIKTAAERAGVTPFAGQRRNGLDSVIGEQGLGLSAGQAQRVALARAFVRQSPILLLDEPTASLDKATEAAIIADLDAWSGNCTMIIATHRAAALSLANRILVLRQGRLVAQGTLAQLRKTHAELLPKE